MGDSSSYGSGSSADGERRGNKSAEALAAMPTSITHLNMTKHVVYNNAVLKAHGGFCDIFLGQYIVPPFGDRKKVALRRIRLRFKVRRDSAKVSWHYSEKERAGTI